MNKLNRKHYRKLPFSVNVSLKDTCVSGVYSSTNWPPLSGGQNSILNWVLKLNPLNQNEKK